MNKSKRLGTSFEVDGVEFLKGHGFENAERRALEGKNDRGDIAGTRYVWEFKNHQALKLAEWIEETKVETANADAPFGFLIVKRRRKSTGEAYAVMTLEQLCNLLKHIPPIQQIT